MLQAEKFEDLKGTFQMTELFIKVTDC
eukprot:Gb_18993 [translate_table: standard]